jgi:intracellular sulfur oxidation DsrE/DsrF family protein
MDQQRIEANGARRWFLSRLGIGAGLLTATVAQPSVARAQIGGTTWRPARHEQDDWLEQIPGKHRFLFDTTTPEALNLALQFGNNYYTTNQQAYGLQDADIAVLFVVRHKSTSFGYNDAMWAKYGRHFVNQAGFSDAAVNQPPGVNVFLTGKPTATFTNAGRLNDLIKRGLHLAVCATSSRGIATAIARDTGGDADKIFEEMGANLLPNTRRVPAGITAVNRAQERGYSFVHAM